MEFSKNSFSGPIDSPIFGCNNGIPNNGPAAVNGVPSIHIAQSVCQGPPKHSDELLAKYKKGRNEVSNMLKKVEKCSVDGLMMIDTLQRLGIDYYFGEEIEQILVSQSMLPTISYHKSTCHHESLYELALRFRLLRQGGFLASSDVFIELKEDELTMENDIKGLMELYEASQLSMEGEDVLEKAGDLSAKILTSWLPHNQSKVIENALSYPYHKTLARLMAKNYLDNMEEENNQDITCFLDFAKLDRCIIQTIYQNEIFQIGSWWEELGLAKELNFARDQPIKWHAWSMAVLSDPNLSEQRVELTKPISLVYIIDDIFDVYGTLEELTLFTKAVDRWDITAAEQLPEYMKSSFKALYDITINISNKILGQYGWNPIDSLRKSWAELCNAFLVEAEWFASGQIPNAEVYLQNGIVSSGVPLVLLHLFFLLGHGLNQQTILFLEANFPSIISSTAKILRLFDDMGTAQDEDQDGKDGSYMVCYMKEHLDVTLEDAKEHVRGLISETWKRLNKECFSADNPFSATFTNACLNVARMVPLMYSYQEDPALPSLNQLIKSLLFETDAITSI